MINQYLSLRKRGAGPIVRTPLGDNTSLLYGLEKQIEAYLPGG